MLVGYVLMYPYGGVVQSQGSAKLYLTEAAARGARTNMFGRLGLDESAWRLSEAEQRALRTANAATYADIVPVYAR